MSLFSGLFRRHKKPAIVIEKPDDAHLQRRLEAAKRVNSRAVQSFTMEAEKQQKEVDFARQVVSDLLARADNIKANRHAGITK